MKHNPDCLFCSLANGLAPAYIVSEDEFVCCLLDTDPIGEGHTLIVPKKPYLDVDELDRDTAVAVMGAAAKLSLVLKRLYHPDGVTIMQNGGHFNDVGHYHMHVFPRYKGDGFGWTYGEGTQKGPEALLRTRQRLKRALRVICQIQ